VTNDRRSALLSVRDVEKTYRDRGGRREVTVLRGISFDLEQGSSLGLLGLSGAGKSTLCRLLLGLDTPDSGSVGFDGEPLPAAGSRLHRKHRGRVQAVFQDPRSSLNPHLDIGAIVGEPLLAQPGTRRTDCELRVQQALRAVALPVDFAVRKPAQLSGGERQRVAIARAIVTEPQLIVLDEPVSALDAVVRREILTLLTELKTRLGLSLILVSHDIRSIGALTDRTIVLHEGRIIEQGPTAEIIDRPEHIMTRQLVSAAGMSFRVPESQQA
jgi:peptide/nickel transport system ATP-binding protein